MKPIRAEITFTIEQSAEQAIKDRLDGLLAEHFSDVQHSHVLWAEQPDAPPRETSPSSHELGPEAELARVHVQAAEERASGRT